MKLNEVVARAVHFLYGSDIHFPDFSCWTCLNGQKAFWVTCPSAHSIFVIWSFPSPYRELYFVLPLLCDLYIYIWSVLSALSNPMFFPCFTVSIPVMAQGFAELTLLLMSLPTSPHKKLIFYWYPCPCIILSPQGIAMSHWGLGRIVLVSEQISL